MSHRLNPLSALWLVLCIAGGARAAELSFPSERTAAWLDDRRIIAVHTDQPFASDTRLDVASSDPAVLRVLRHAEFLAGHDLGFLRVEARREGTAELRVGDATLTVDVRPSTANWLTEQRRPRITAPVRGAAAWGTIGVAVEVFDDLGRLGGDPTVMRLKLPDGKQLEAAAVSSPDQSPHRRFTFALDTETLPTGPVEITAELDANLGGPRTSRPFTLRIYRRNELQLAQGEAEDWETHHRPRRYGGTRKLPLGDDPAASGDRFVHNNGSNPALTIDLPVDEPGWYQAVARVAADPAAGTLPALAVRLDANDRDTTVSQLADTGWHRVPIGRPFRLTKPAADERRPEPQPDGDAPAYTWPDGQRVLTLRFANDFNAGRGQDRNLRIDRYEIARLPGRPPAPTATRDSEHIPADAVRELFIALDPSLHGRHLGGDFEAAARIGGLEDGNDSPPEVTLEIDGEPVATQHSARPNFRVSVGQLAEDRKQHKIQVSVKDPATGTVARSAAHAVTLADGIPPTQPRRTHVFHAAAPAWQSDVATRRDRGKVSNEPAFGFFSEGAATLTLPDDMEGRFDVVVWGWADEYDGLANAKVTLDVSGELNDVGEREFRRYPQQRTVGNVTLERGAKSLRVAFTNDHYDAESQRDRNLYVHALILRERGASDTAPPVVKLRHPQHDAVLGRYDVAVIDVADDRGVVWAEALIDGQPTGVRHRVADGVARIAVPLVLRDVPAGPVNISVRVEDDAGNTAETTQASVTLNPDAAPGTTPYARAVHLLNRLGYGPEPALLADVLADGEAATLDRLLSAGFGRDAGLTDAWVRAAVDRTNEESLGNLRQRAARHQLQTPDPLRGRLTMFLDNHFTTWWRKARSENRLDEHARWVHLGAAPFPELLTASATSPAMLRYLDQERSFAKRLNENYAREIMELHTLGVDAGYTQEDVTSLAKLLTGWSYAAVARDDGHGRLLDQDFRYIADRNLPDAQTVFGMRFDQAKRPRDRFDRARTAVEFLAAHPATANFIAEKLVGHYAGLPADPQLVDAGRAAFLETHGDLHAVVAAIATHPRFFDAELPGRVSHPAGFAFRLQRLADTVNPGRVIEYTNAAGFGLFDRDTPDGYPEEDDAYADSNATLQRWRYAGHLADAFVNRLPHAVREPGDFSDDQAGADAQAAWRQQLVDHFAGMITGHLLSETSNQAALDVLTQTELRGKDRLRLAAQFIAQLPESALR